MKQYIVIIFSILLLWSPESFGSRKSQGLKIGDKVPDVTVNNILNYSTSSLKLSDFKGKVLILDFWATWCTSCLNNLHKYASLSKEFGGDVFILPVTYQDKPTVQKFFAGKAGNGLNFPTVFADTELSILFPHYGIPHYVWIGPDGIVRAITNSEELVPDKIKAMINDPEEQAWQVKKDLDAKKPLFLSEDYPKDNEIVNYTIFSKGNYSGFTNGSKLRYSGNVVNGRAITNATLLTLYETMAYPLFSELKDSYSGKRLVLNIKDSSEVMRRPGSTAVPVYYNFEMKQLKPLVNWIYWLTMQACTVLRE